MLHTVTEPCVHCIIIWQTIRQFSSVVKTLAMSCSVFLSASFTIVVQGILPPPLFVAGAVVVLTGVYVYSTGAVNTGATLNPPAATQASVPSAVPTLPAESV